jgi:prevent-host-death family protein
MPSLTATQARNHFSELLRDAGNEVVQITQHNKPAAAVMSWEIYESMLETLEILSDPETLNLFQQGITDINAGRLTDWEVVKERIESDR